MSSNIYYALQTFHMQVYVNLFQVFSFLIKFWLISFLSMSVGVC